jgi:hypothetical protein
MAEYHMRYKIKWLDLSYEARFTAPLFSLAAAPVEILKAVHARVSPKYRLNSSDLAVDSGRSMADVRAKVSLFGGNGVLEISADSLSARFNNPTAPKDLEVVKDCIQLALDALFDSTGTDNVAFSAEVVSLRMFAELLDNPSDARSFLRSLSKDTRVYKANQHLSAEVVPGLKYELEKSKDKWHFSFDVSRAIRAENELFISSSTSFLEGSAFQGLEAKARHIEALLDAAFAWLGLESFEE